MLQEIAKRFKQSLRAVDVVGRLGGDEFIMLIEEVDELSQVALIAQKLLSSAMKPIVLQGEECRDNSQHWHQLIPQGWNGRTNPDEKCGHGHVFCQRRRQE